jgi:peptidoglycan/xylan/chitin deacetylase (PgdA/CDA1 family)
MCGTDSNFVFYYSARVIVPAQYPALDTVPPVNSPQVQQWIKDVQQSGVAIPSISQTVLGGCSANPAAVSDQSRCWWTCGGCTRNTDIVSCPDKMTWGLTYDDGPAFYTPNLLQYLDQQNLKTTFFVVGSRALEFPALLQEEFMGQHQIAVHTWSHPYLTTLSNEQIIAELGWSKKIFKDVLGITPNMFRPPYGDIDDRVRAISLAMGLIPVMWTRVSATATFDTGGKKFPDQSQRASLNILYRFQYPQWTHECPAGTCELGIYPWKREHHKHRVHRIGARPVPAIGRRRNRLYPSRCSCAQSQVHYRAYNLMP